MGAKQPNKKKSIFRSLVISNFVVLTVAFVVALVAFEGYQRFSSEQAEDYNTVILRQIREAFDNKIESINKLILNVSFDNDVNNLRSMEQKITNEERYLSVQVLNSLGSYSAIYNFLDSVALYYKSSDRIITNTSAYASSEHFLSNADSAYWEKGEWESFFTGKRQYHMNENIFTVISPLYYDNSIFLVLNIDASFVSALTGNIRSLENSLMAVTDDDTGELLFSFGNERLREYAGTTGAFTLERERYNAYALNSNIQAWTYSFILPNNAFIENALDLLTISLVVLLLLGGIVTSLLLAKRNFRPIRQIASSIAERMGVNLEEQNGKDELELIDETSHRAIDEYQTIKTVMDKYSLVLRAKLLEQLLRGVLEADQLSEEDQRVGGISFPHSEFYLMLLSVQERKEQNASLTRRISPLMMEYIGSLYGGEVAGCAYPVELALNRICVIVNLPQYENAAAEQLVRKISEYGYRNFGIVVTAAIGSCTEGARLISTRYIQCVRALERQLIRYPGVTVFTDQMEAETGVYYYSLEQESRLIDSVKAGNLKNVNEILDTVIIENFVNSSLTLEVSRCLFFNLMGTAIKVIGTLGYSTDEIFEDGNYTNKITSCTDIQDMEATLRQMFYAICIYLNGRKRQDGQMIDQIVEHITVNSADPNISLLTVASAFGMNANYLSSYFKEQKGGNFLAFLNSVRIEEASALLKGTSLSLEDIALKVGYSGSAVLIRNFKRYLQITPGQYREQMK